MDIDAIMTRHIVSVSMDDNLKTIRKLFHSEQFHHLLVMESDRQLAGIISDRDFFRAISPNASKDCACAKDLATLNKKAHQIMSRHPVVLQSGTSVETAIRVLVKHSLSCLPVVDTQGIAVGIVSWKDILRYMTLLKIPAARTADSA